jgi:hypothetical protein
LASAREPPSPVGFLAQDREHMARFADRFSTFRRDRHVQKIAEIGNTPHDLDFPDVAFSFDTKIPHGFQSRFISPFPKGSRPGTMKTTSSVMRSSTVVMSPFAGCQPGFNQRADGPLVVAHGPPPSGIR